MPKLNARDIELELIAAMGGDALDGSGFETEQPDPDFDPEQYEAEEA